MKKVFTLLAFLLTAVSSFALTIEEGKVYTISNRNDNNLYVQDNGDDVIAMGAKNDNSLWILEDAGNGFFYVKNFTTGRYAQECATSAEVPVTLGNTPVAYSIVDCSAQEGENCFGLTSTNETVTDFTAGCIGWNWDNARVQTYAAVAGTNHKSFWKITEAPTSVTLDKAEYKVGDPVVVTYINTPGGATDWMAIYKSEQTPGNGVNSSTYRYVSGKSGKMTLNVEDAPNWEGAIGVGDYYVAYLLNDGYTEGLGRVAFVVKDPAVAGEEDITSCINNSDFELTEGMIADGSNFRGIPTGWKAWGKRGETEYNQEPGVKDTELLPGQSYGENGGCAATRHADKSYWLNPSTMPDDLKLYQEVALEAGNYRLTCLLSPMSQGDDQFTNLRLYAGDNASYFGSEDKYGVNLGSETNKTFMGYSVDMDGGDPRMKQMTLEFTLAEAATIELGIRTGNMQKNGDRGNDNRGRFRCDYFTLTKIENLHVHDYSHNGICTCDGAAKYEEPTLVDGYYLLDNAGKVEWFSHKVDLGGDANLQINGKLTADIDFTDITHMPIGQTTGKKYNGVFDGQGHRIMNMVIYRPDDSNIGFFGFLRGNAKDTKVLNLIMDKTCSITAANRAGGIAGSCQNNGATITIENCINEASVTVSGQDAAGFVGGVEDNNPKWIIRNCVNAGTITSTHDFPYVGALFCYQGNGESVIENFINIGTINGHRGGNMGRMSGTIRNLVDLSDTNMEGTVDGQGQNRGLDSGLTSEAIASGELAYYMNSHSYNGNGNFKQLIGTDAYPSPLNETEVKYVGAAGYSTLCKDADFELNGDVQASIITGADANGLLTETSVSIIPANEGVLLAGTYYNILDASNSAENCTGNKLVGVLTDTQAPVGSYVLQKLNEKVAFYRVADGKQPNVKAGKAYLDIPDANINALFFDEEDATAINGVNETINSNAIYNVAGQRISKMQRGVNIVNGKKVLF